jgi:hypothetical protein
MNMNTQHLYTVRYDDDYIVARFPLVEEELSALFIQVSPLPVAFRQEIILAFVANRTLETSWAEANPQLVQILTQGMVCTENIVALFNASAGNQIFRRAFEQHMYIKLSAYGKLFQEHASL